MHLLNILQFATVSPAVDFMSVLRTVNVDDGVYDQVYASFRYKTNIRGFILSITAYCMLMQISFQELH